jgi:acetyl esterase/lipase
MGRPLLERRSKRTLLLGTSAALIAVAGIAALLKREDLSWYIRLFRAYRVGKRFYAEYPHLARNVAFHPEMAPRLDVYSPESGSGHPVLVFVHGGSWDSYHKELFAPVAMKLVPEGMVVVIPDYTLYPDAGYEQMTREVAAAVSWTLENVTAFGGDPGRVIVAGHSAGAHLSALAIMDERWLEAAGHSSREICGWVGMSGVYDVQAEADYWRARGDEPRTMTAVMGGAQRFGQASPISYVRPDLPPVLLIHGQEDKTVPVEIAVDLQARLQGAGANSELKIYPQAGHTDFLFDALLEDRAPVVADLAEFVHQCQP